MRKKRLNKNIDTQISLKCTQQRSVRDEQKVKILNEDSDISSWHFLMFQFFRAVVIVERKGGSVQDEFDNKHSCYNPFKMSKI